MATEAAKGVEAEMTSGQVHSNLTVGGGSGHMAQLVGLWGHFVWGVRVLCRYRTVCALRERERSERKGIRLGGVLPGCVPGACRKVLPSRDEVVCMEPGS